MTVLEKQLLPIALNISDQKIEEMDANTSMQELVKILYEHSITKEEDKDSNQDVEEDHEKDSVIKRSPSSMSEDSIRVHVTLLNNLLNLASEMVLGRNQLLRVIEEYRKNIPGIDPILQNIDRITTELQEKIMQTRMQPIANVFNKFPRIIRDLSKSLGKDMNLQLEGAEVELDKSIIEALTDPLTHLVRNAADHGLEGPEVRESLGKPRTGQITLKAYHEGGYVNIDIKDDGAGINVEKVKEKAVEKGLLNKSEFGIMSEQEILQLIFKPGFSTADKVTDVSGRGVGMDVVKTNIEKLGGIIEIFTTVGGGTTFRLLLPLTLAIIPSLIVEVEEQKFALPQVNLHEIVRIKPDDLSRRIEYIHDSEVLRLSNKLLPIIHLADVLGLKRTYIDPDTGEKKAERRITLLDNRRKFLKAPEESLGCKRKNSANITRILVLRIGSKSFGIAVDDIHGSEEILVKPLPKFVKDSKCYSGVTIMGDGKIAMILDLEGIVEKASLKFFEELNEKAEKELIETSYILNEQQNLLLFKCSGPELFGIDLSMVSRVDEVSVDEIEKIGDKEFIKVSGGSLRIIRPEDFLSVGQSISEKTKLYVIIPKLVKHPIGILIQKIHDNMHTAINLDIENIKTRGIMGSTILNNRIVLLVNVYELFEMADPEHYKIGDSKNTGENRTVLLVEDTMFFEKIEKSYLEASGYNVLVAKNGKHALQILQEKEVDIIVSDIHMPIMDGFELVRRVRADKRYANLPIIAVTSMFGGEQREAGLKAGFDFYEFKLDREGLLEKINIALQKRRKAI